MKWKRTKKGSKDHKDGKPPATDEDQKLEIDEGEESEPEDNFNIEVDSPHPDIDEPESPPGLEVKTEREENNPFYCSQTKTPHILPHQHFLTSNNFTRFNHCPPFPLSQNTFLRSERESEDNQD